MGEHSPPVKDSSDTVGEEEKRNELIGQLVMDLLKNSWELQGIPVGRIGPMQAFHMHQQLPRGVPRKRGMRRQEMISCLREISLWEVGSAAELWIACQKRGIEEDLKETLLSHLKRNAHVLPSQKNT